MDTRKYTRQKTTGQNNSEGYHNSALKEHQEPRCKIKWQQSLRIDIPWRQVSSNLVPVVPRGTDYVKLKPIKFKLISRAPAQAMATGVKWTEAEDAEVVKGFMRHGTSWRRIRTELNLHRCRTENDIKCRWRVLCRKKGFLAQHADALIAMLVGAENDLRESAASELESLDPATLAQRVDVHVAMLAVRGAHCLDTNPWTSAHDTAGLVLENGWLDRATLGQQADALLALLKLFVDDAVNVISLNNGLVRSADLAWCVRECALETLRLLEPATLAQHADTVLAWLKDSDWHVRTTSLEALGELYPATLAQHADAVVAMLEDPEDQVCSMALKTMCHLDPARLAQYADELVVRLEDSVPDVRMDALCTLARMEPATLVPHADAVVAMLDDEGDEVRRMALMALGRLEPATLAQHADAVVAMREDQYHEVRLEALWTLGELDPAALAQHADAVFEMLEDSDPTVRAEALETMCKLDQATLVLHANAAVAMLKDTGETFEVWTGVPRVRQVRVAALAPLSALPHYLIRGIDFDELQKRALASENAREPLRDSREFEVLHSKLLGRLCWYRCRLRWRVQRLVPYWYALPYRPSGPGHARDVEAWDRMNETRGQTPRLQLPEQSGAEADESTSSESLTASTWTCHRCRYQNYGANRCALCGSPQTQPAAGPHETTRARKRRR